jgi:VanZ family protein
VSAAPSLLRRISLWLPPLLYMIAIFHFSSESQPLPMLAGHVWDKLLHTIEYFGLAILVFRAFDGEGLEGWRPAILTVVMVSGYGATDEWHQWYVPLRQADVRDWMTDTLAGTIGAAAWLWLSFYRGNRRKRRE